MPGVGGRLSEGQTRKSSLPYLPQASLGDFIAELKQRMPRSGSEGFIAPSDAGRRAFTMAIAAALDGAWPVDAISMLHYDLALLHDRSFAQNYLVFHEKQNNRSGLGTYILNLRPRRNIVLEVPHPLFDLDTPEQAAQIFQQTGARALFISGTHRCANAAISPCSSAGSSACNEQTRISDTAHFTQNLFQAAHEATLVLRSPPVALSIHGNSVGGLPDFVLSDGTRQVRSESSTVNRLRAALVARGASAGSCNFAADGVTQLCGGTNVQGRLSNGSIEPCTTNATGSTGLFLHIEQHLNVRREPAQLIEAMKEVFPAGN
jgi:hypothetical protein